MVEPALSHGAEVWGVQLVAKKAAASPEGSAGSAICSFSACMRCAAEKLQMGFLRGLLGVRQAAPNALIPAETGETPLWQRWLRRTTKYSNAAVRSAPDSLVRQALATTGTTHPTSPLSPL